jgi:3-methyladenine DNA glycosylase AlkC
MPPGYHDRMAEAVSQIIRANLGRYAIRQAASADVPAIVAAMAEWDTRGNTRSQLRRLREGRRRIRGAQAAQIPAIIRDLAQVNHPAQRQAR